MIEIFIVAKVIIIYTNYSAVIDVIRQNNIYIMFIEKLNFRLIRILKYFQRFRIKLKHKFDKINIILNVLSKLTNRFSNRFETKFSIFNIDFFSINIVIVNEFFRKRIAKDYQNKSK